eukprot:UN28635
MKHKMLKQEVYCYDYATDENGFIYFPVLNDIEYITAFNKKWYLPEPSLTCSELDPVYITEAYKPFSIPRDFPKEVVLSQDNKLDVDTLKKTDEQSE